jgi:hypothetical protein
VKESQALGPLVLKRPEGLGPPRAQLRLRRFNMGTNLGKRRIPSLPVLITLKRPEGRAPLVPQPGARRLRRFTIGTNLGKGRTPSPRSLSRRSDLKVVLHLRSERLREPALKLTWQGWAV